MIQHKYSASKSLCNPKAICYKIQAQALAIRGNNQKGDLEIMQVVPSNCTPEYDYLYPKAAYKVNKPGNDLALKQD